MSAHSININMIITLDICQNNRINISVTDILDNILDLHTIQKINTDNYLIRQQIISTIHSILSQYDIDTLIVEKNKLPYCTGMLYSDLNILQNCELNLSILTSIEDNFYNSIKYIFEIPTSEWNKTMFNTQSLFIMDKYKNFIQQTELPEHLISTINYNNFYRTLCLSRCHNYYTLLKKFWVNKRRMDSEKG